MSGEAGECEVSLLAKQKSFVWAEDSTGSGSTDDNGEDWGEWKRFEQLAETRKVLGKVRDESAKAYADRERKLEKYARYATESL